MSFEAEKMRIHKHNQIVDSVLKANVALITVFANNNQCLTEAEQTMLSDAHILVTKLLCSLKNRSGA
ncbi:MAG: hypothetical protein FWG55_07205 [Candidatus Bathyarchaeota archaeon]|nr:hypothetical protein [Candidatus Termiticorpusculum sp.]